MFVVVWPNNIIKKFESKNSRSQSRLSVILMFWKMFRFLFFFVFSAWTLMCNHIYKHTNSHYTFWCQLFRWKFSLISKKLFSSINQKSLSISLQTHLCFDLKIIRTWNIWMWVENKSISICNQIFLFSLTPNQNNFSFISMKF